MLYLRHQTLSYFCAEPAKSLQLMCNSPVLSVSVKGKPVKSYCHAYGAILYFVILLCLVDKYTLYVFLKYSGRKEMSSEAEQGMEALAGS